MISLTQPMPPSGRRHPPAPWESPTAHPRRKENGVPLGSDGARGGFPAAGTVVASTRRREGY
ncbi:hypothetical protein SCWH03_48400 [Streptomyces pacificus]|uniref:Uncharacterized protein n=1 Tax=Streptomyces pacificus TaxID=2705029 RepID=A0A6A0B1W7_9ACTN|nr:hypothetical protein SCWH03_48400 [Streptomyces pacificus]